MNTLDKFLATDLAVSRKLYRPETIGTVFIQHAAVPALVLLTERRPQEAQQYQFSLPADGQVTRRLPAGVYAISVTAKGQKPYRDTIEITDGQVTTVEPRLEPRETNEPTFEQKLAELGIQGPQPPIMLQPGEQVVLDAQAARFRDNLHQINLNTPDDFKRVLGHPDTLWPGEVSRFGAEIPEAPEAGPDLTQSYGFRAALREWVYGNSKSVQRWGDVLVTGVSELGLPSINLFASIIVEVGPNAVLTIGNHGMICGTLRVHVTGAVKTIGGGPLLVWMETYEQFS
jgi:hypothetical protein